MSNTLLPCPFCGGKARWMYRKPIGRVMCKKCGASSAALSDNYEEADCQQEAIAAWNRRAGDDTNVATNADRIRGMSDEELACLLDSFRCGNCMRRGNNCFPGSIENWLRQPAKEE